MIPKVRLELRARLTIEVGDRLLSESLTPDRVQVVEVPLRDWRFSEFAISADDVADWLEETLRQSSCLVNGYLLSHQVKP